MEKQKFNYHEYHSEWREKNPDKVLMSRIRTYKRFLAKIKAQRPDLYKEALKTL